ncbi:hypothetical protein CWI39_1458p0020 [Hamiltosporidium magnivora]|uniref:Uncharacterized protein n=1 Tax=Hamiltosporidium magnivora TaxID=148818 RepID=A0A4Q9L3T8_9MICR|nr:hypothetical protein CWI39_1458p0020 [Hamiltosporidium magnivora]
MDILKLKKKICENKMKYSLQLGNKKVFYKIGNKLFIEMTGNEINKYETTNKKEIELNIIKCLRNRY